MISKQSLAAVSAVLSLLLLSVRCCCDATPFGGQEDPMLSREDGVQTNGEDARLFTKESARRHDVVEAILEIEDRSARQYIPLNSLTFMTANSSASTIDWTSTDASQIRQHIAGSKLAGVPQTSTIPPKNATSRLPPFPFIRSTTTKRPRTTTRPARPTLKTAAPFTKITEAVNYRPITVRPDRPITKRPTTSNIITWRPDTTLLENTTPRRTTPTPTPTTPRPPRPSIGSVYNTHSVTKQTSPTVTTEEVTIHPTTSLPPPPDFIKSPLISTWRPTLRPIPNRVAVVQLSTTQVVQTSTYAGPVTERPTWPTTPAVPISTTQWTSSIIPQQPTQTESAVPSKVPGAEPEVSEQLNIVTENEPLSHWQSLDSVNYPNLQNIQRYTSTFKPTVTDPISENDQKIINEALDRFHVQPNSSIKNVNTEGPQVDEQDTDIPQIATVEQPGTVGLAPQQPLGTNAPQQEDNWTFHDDIIWHFDSDGGNPIHSGIDPNTSWITNPRPQKPYIQQTTSSSRPTTTPHPSLFEIVSSLSTGHLQTYPHRITQQNITTLPSTRQPPHTTSKQDLFTVATEESHFYRNPILRPLLGPDVHVENQGDLFSISQSEELPSTPHASTTPPPFADGNDDYDFDYAIYEENLSEYYAAYGYFLGEDSGTKADEFLTLDKDPNSNILETVTWPYTTIHPTYRPFHPDSSLFDLTGRQPVLSQETFSDDSSLSQTSFHNKVNENDYSLSLPHASSLESLNNNTNLTQTKTSHSHSTEAFSDYLDYLSLSDNISHNSNEKFQPNKPGTIHSYQQNFSVTLSPTQINPFENTQLQLDNNPHNLNIYNVGFLDTAYIPKATKTTTTTRKPPVLYTPAIPQSQSSSSGTLSSDIDTIVVVNPIRPAPAFTDLEDLGEASNEDSNTNAKLKITPLPGKTSDVYAHYGHVSQNTNLGSRIGIVQPNTTSVPSVPLSNIARNNLYHLVSSPFLVQNEKAQIYSHKFEEIHNHEQKFDEYEHQTIWHTIRPDYVTPTISPPEQSLPADNDAGVPVTSSNNFLRPIISPYATQNHSITTTSNSVSSIVPNFPLTSIRPFIVPPNLSEGEAQTQDESNGQSVKRIGLTPPFHETELQAHGLHPHSSNTSNIQSSEVDAAIHGVNLGTHLHGHDGQDSSHTSSSDTVTDFSPLLRPDNFSVQFTESGGNLGQSEGVHQHHQPTSNEIRHTGSSSDHHDHPLYVLVKIWSMVDGQLRLVEEQPVPTEMFQNSGLSNGAVVNPQDVPSTVLSAIAEKMEDSSLLSPVLGNSLRYKRSFHDGQIKDNDETKKQARGNSENTENSQIANDNDYMTQTADTYRVRNAMHDWQPQDMRESPSKTPRIGEESIGGEPPVVHFIIPNIKEQPSFNTLLQRLAILRQNQKQGQTLNSNRDLPTDNPQYSHTIGDSSNSMNTFHNPNSQGQDVALDSYSLPVFGGVGNNDLPMTPSPVLEHHAPPPVAIPVPAKTNQPEIKYFGGVGNQNYSNLPLNIGTTLNEDNVSYLQILSKLADRIRSSSSQNPTLNNFIGHISQTLPDGQVPQRGVVGYNAGGTLFANGGAVSGSSVQQLLQKPSIPSEHRGSVLELLPSDLPHVNPLLSPGDPVDQPVPLVNVLSSLPSPSTLHQEQLRNKLTSITGTNTFSGHLGNQGLFSQNNHASQNSVLGNYGQQAAFTQLDPEAQTPQAQFSPATFNRLSLQPSLLLGNSHVNSRPNFPPLLPVQQNNPAFPVTFNQQPVFPEAFPLSSNPEFNYQSPDDPIQASVQQPLYPASQQQTNIRRPDILSLIEQLQSQSQVQTQDPTLSITQPEGTFSLPLQQPAEFSPFDPSLPYVPFQSGSSFSDSPLIPSFPSDTIDPTAATISSSSVQGCVQDRLCSLGLASLLALGISNAIALPFLTPMFLGRRRRQLDLSKTSKGQVQSMENDFLRDLLTLAIRADKDFMDVISLTSDFIAERPMGHTMNDKVGMDSKTKDYSRILTALGKDQIPVLVRHAIYKITSADSRQKLPENSN